MTSPALYRVHPTPVGDALIMMTDDGLVALDVLEDTADDALLALSHELRMLPQLDDEDGPTAAVATQLDEYFTGIRRDFDVNLDWRLAHGFARAALERVREIPYGETATYGEIAILAGSPGAHRAVGTACARTPVSIIVPAHRVVRSDGTIGLYGRYPEVKRYLIDLEARNAAGE